MNTCETCQWFKEPAHMCINKGHCQVHPPVYVKGEGAWPSVYPSDFCGRWMVRLGDKR